jgi:hypothetical protein
MSDDDMYWPHKYPWSRRPAPRTLAHAPVMFRAILTLLWAVFISGIVFAALAIIPNVKAQDQDTLRRHIKNDPGPHKTLDYRFQNGKFATCCGLRSLFF